MIDPEFLEPRRCCTVITSLFNHLTAVHTHNIKIYVQTVRSVARELICFELWAGDGQTWLSWHTISQRASNVLVTKPTTTQNSSFLPPVVAETIASNTHCTYTWRHGQAEQGDTTGSPHNRTRCLDSDTDFRTHIIWVYVTQKRLQMTLLKQSYRPLNAAAVVADYTRFLHKWHIKTY